MTGHYEKQD